MAFLTVYSWSKRKLISFTVTDIVLRYNREIGCKNRKKLDSNKFIKTLQRLAFHRSENNQKNHQPSGYYENNQ